MSLVQLIFAALLVLANGFFVGAEFALVSVRRSQVEPLAAAGSSRARQVLHGLENLPQMMAAAQFGITVCSLTLGAVAEPTVAHLLEPVFHAAHLPEGLVHPLGFAVALVSVVFLHLVIGEMVPKNLAMAAPEKTAMWLSPGLVGFARLCSTRHLRARGLRPDRAQALQGRAEGRGGGRLHQRAAQPAGRGRGLAGLLEPEAQERLGDALELGSRPVTDVLLGRASLVTVDPSVTPAASRN